MTTTTERRRNAFPDTCCHCRCDVPAGEGWLYSDTRQHRSFRGGYRRFPKKVKCDRCHREGVTNRYQARQLDGPPALPAPRSYSAPEVARWSLEVEVQDDQPMTIGCDRERQFAYIWGTGRLVEVHVTLGGERIMLAGGDIITNTQRTLDGRWEDEGLAGRPFSPAAWKRLVERIDQAIANAK